MSFEKLWVWSYENIRRKLNWYYEVSINKKPAKYLICRRIPCSLDLRNSDEDELWKEHDRLSEEFLDLFQKVKNEEVKIENIPVVRPNFLDLKVELAKRLLKHCEFCRWNCRVDRTKGEKLGTCQLEDISRVSSYFHHRGEELVFRGTMGSGTIFFTSCNMRCAFCQNGDISTDRFNGIPITPRQLALMMWQLRMEGCHNINLVGGEPTIHFHTIIEAIRELCELKPSQRDLNYILNAYSDFFIYKMDPRNAYYNNEFNAPILWNSNFFMSDKLMKLLREIVDIYLPDFKFGNNNCAIKLSRTPWYFETVSRNHKLVYEWGDNMVIRHLIMPNHVECCSKPVLKWINENMPDVLVNIMYQYHPDNFCNPLSSKYDKRYAEIARYPTKQELLEVYRYAQELGLDFVIVSFDKVLTSSEENLEELVDSVLI
jgi:putative pyruvate formate lyase activating enzyme